jgi:tRNA (adenine37-N6)-methyltransferase
MARALVPLPAAITAPEPAGDAVARARRHIEPEEDAMEPDDTLKIHPIGIIRSPFHEAEGTPIQPAFAEGIEGTVHVEAALEPALKDLEGFERIWLIYWLHRAGPFRPVVVPYRDVRPHGLFATRSPSRPCGIGISAVRLLGREGSLLRVADIDILDGTPLLDIKPYVPAFDAYPGSKAGWLDECVDGRRTADGRFHRNVDEGGPPSREKGCIS